MAPRSEGHARVDCDTNLRARGLCRVPGRMHEDPGPDAHRLVMRPPGDAPVLLGNLHRDGIEARQLRGGRDRGFTVGEMREAAPQARRKRRRSRHEQLTGLLQLDSGRAEIEQVGGEDLQLVGRSHEDEQEAHVTTARTGWRPRELPAR